MLCYSVMQMIEHSPLLGSATANNLQSITKELERCIDLSRGSNLPAVCLKEGEAVCARSSEDSVWYRATVQSIQDDQAVVSGFNVYTYADVIVV